MRPKQMIESSFPQINMTIPNAGQRAFIISHVNLVGNSLKPKMINQLIFKIFALATGQCLLKERMITEILN